MDTSPAPSTTPPVGPSTVATSGGALVAFGLALWAVIHGDRSAETIAALGTGLGLILALVASRTSQANKLAEKLPALPAAPSGSPAPLGVAMNSAKAGEPVLVGLDVATGDAPTWLRVSDGRTVETSNEAAGTNSVEWTASVLPEGVSVTPREVPPDLDDSAHALTDGDPAADVALSPADMIDEGASADDPEGNA